MGFNQIIIGFVFIFFHFTISSIDILPDFIGYLFIFYGTRSLLSHFHNDRFINVKWSSLLLIVLSALDLFIHHSAVLNGVIDNNQLSGRLFSFISFIVTATLLAFSIYHLCKGIELEARRIENAELTSKATWTYKFFFSYQLVTVIFHTTALFIAKRSLELNLTGTTGTILFIALFFS
ncbi:hypothetical protein NIE88_06190 [Sporolactobacillus shoreicorticis]|uniref:Uncharacterized protein n=1 Tax=Sporolactobacillus shoreicorticis TaxID=1923877 RepID=A0ABW5S162_9BACL|nr:hypothetical protein [Sporolactobacillus shoreicorticis]MCO7125355.1 hypothetical protein [Sporolactobacillus shoreicorticis]